MTYRIGKSYFKQVLRLCVKSTPGDLLADPLAASETEVTCLKMDQSNLFNVSCVFYSRKSGNIFTSHSTLGHL